MSRGLGKLQRRLLAELKEHGVSSVQKLCARIFRKWPVSDSNYSAARRAMRGLMRRGLVAEALPRKQNWCRGRSDLPTWQNQYVLQPDANRHVPATLSDGVNVPNVDTMGRMQRLRT